MLLKAGYVMMAFAVALCGVATAIVWTDEPARSAAVKSAEQEPAEPLKRTDPGVEPWKEERAVLPSSEEPEPEKPEPGNNVSEVLDPVPEHEPEEDPKPQPPEPKRDDEPEPGRSAEPESEVGEEPPELPDEQTASAHEPRQHGLPDGAVLGLTVKAIGLQDVPVFDSVKEWALGSGVGHHPETSMPWSDAPQRNVYLAGHKLGFPGTASHLVFYRLGELGEGDEILLRDREGKEYRYRVSETFKADPDDSWVMGQVIGRDMVTLQTCVGPNLERRLIVLADRV